MARPTDERPRVIGPVWLEGKQRWRIIAITPDAPLPENRRTESYYRTQEEADAAKEELEGSLTDVTMESAITKYEAYLSECGTVEDSRRETCRRLRLFFPDLDMRVNRMTPERAAQLYDIFRARLRPDGEPISVAYHRAALINARSLYTWSIKQKWIRTNPFAEVKGVGRRNAGKDQLTADETVRFYAYCEERAHLGDEAALAVLMALTMALRSSDLTRRIVREVDMGGTMLRVTNGKTEKSNRPRRIAESLQPLVKRLIEGRGPFEPLFKTPYTESGHHTRRWLEEAMVRFCKGAGVPYVCPHALKGMAGNLLAEEGELADRIANHLSHTDKRTTTRHYVNKLAIQQGQINRAMKVIAGGRK